MGPSVSTAEVAQEFVILSYSYWGCIQLFRERLSEKNLKKHATRPKGGLGIQWNFAYWPGVNLQACVFARGKFVFPLRGLSVYSFTFPVACP